MIFFIFQKIFISKLSQNLMIFIILRLHKFFKGATVLKPNFFFKNMLILVLVFYNTLDLNYLMLQMQKLNI